MYHKTSLSLPAPAPASMSVRRPGGSPNPALELLDGGGERHPLLDLLGQGGRHPLPLPRPPLLPWAGSQHVRLYKGVRCVAPFASSRNCIPLSGRKNKKRHYSFKI